MLLSAARRVAGRSLVARGSLATQRRAYHDEVIDHYENPRNVGKSSGQYRCREEI
jgi:hypothetical protein